MRLREIRRSFSWLLALLFIAAGALLAVVTHDWGVDYDGRGFVEDAGGPRVVYEIQGGGFPMVLLAGGPGISHHAFHPHLGRLAERARLIYFDPRGRGRSEEADAYRVADDVRDIERLRRSLSLESFDLLGVSYGAHLAVSYTLAHPGSVRKLVLVSPLVGRTAWQEHLDRLLAAPGMAEALDEIRRERGEVRLASRSTRDRILRVLEPLYWCDPERARRRSGVFRRWHRIARQNFAVYEDIVGRPFGRLDGDLASSRIEERLEEIAAPALLIEGRCDGVLPSGHVRWLEEKIPAARRVLLPASGHSPFIEEPERFARTVAEFLDGT